MGTAAAVGKRSGGEPFHPSATDGHDATPGHVRGLGEGHHGATQRWDRESRRQWGGGDGMRGEGGRGEEGCVEEAGAWQAGVEADHVRVEEDPKHHHPQRPHRHLWYVHLILSHPSLCMLIFISF
jgi:hypothetical protein